MAKVRNQQIYSTDHANLKRLAEEYTFIGRDIKLDLSESKLTVFALPLTSKKKRKQEAKRKRAKQQDSYEDYSRRAEDPLEV